MKNYKQQIKEYKEEIEEKYVRAEAENKTVKACQNILSESVLSKQSHRTSYFEFLYEQTKFIKKRWWILQGCVLMCLWIWLSNYTSDIKDMMRIMGISATIFVVLIIPEIWKNRRNGAIEIEQASYYTLRQICTARILMFGVVDLVIVMVFLAITYQTTILSLSDLVVNFLLPVNVSYSVEIPVITAWVRDDNYVHSTKEIFLGEPSLEGFLHQFRHHLQNKAREPQYKYLLVENDPKADYRIPYKDCMYRMYGEDDARAWARMVIEIAS